MSNKNGMAKNGQVIKEQWQLYKREVATRIWPELQMAWADRDIPELFHKLHALVEEAIDLMPRIWSYLVYPTWFYISYLLIRAYAQ